MATGAATRVASYFKENVAPAIKGARPKAVASGSVRVVPDAARAHSLVSALRAGWAAKQLAASQDTLSMGLSELVADGESIERVRKEDAFADVSEGDKAIIQKRVEQQRRAYAEFQRREQLQKLAKILQVHPHVTRQEAELGLVECEGKEDEAVISFVDVDFLQVIRQRVAAASDETKAAARNARAGVAQYQRRMAAASPEKRQRLNPTRVATTEAKSRTRVMRIALDDALAQGSTEGWSTARIRCFDQIDTNPNAYYYRFNRPGEKQGTGVFSQAERERFMARLAEVGADGKWGLFSLKMPGRVGYQCANFYRQLLQRGEIIDSNYVFDEKGKFKFVGRHRRSKAAERSVWTLGTEASLASMTAALGGDAAAAAAELAADAGSGEGGEGAPIINPVARAIKKRRLNNGAAVQRPTSKAQRVRAPKASAAPTADGAAAAAGTGGASTGRKRRRRGSRSDSAEDYAWRPKASYYSTRRLRGIDPATSAGPLVNPLPGFRDPVTMEDVVVPAMSPAGHVMSHDTWRQCLSERGKCPFTNQVMTLKDLVVLTGDNIETYRARIVNY